MCWLLAKKEKELELRKTAMTPDCIISGGLNCLLRCSRSSGNMSPFYGCPGVTSQSHITSRMMAGRPLTAECVCVVMCAWIWFCMQEDDASDALSFPLCGGEIVCHMIVPVLTFSLDLSFLCVSFCSLYVNDFTNCGNREWETSEWEEVRRNLGGRHNHIPCLSFSS